MPGCWRWVEFLCMRGILAAIALLLLAACGTSPTPPAPTTTPDMHAWAQHLDPVLGELDSDMKWIGAAMQSLDLADARAGCRHLTATTTHLQQLLPSPNPQVDAPLQRAVADYTALADTCQGLNPTTSQAQIDSIGQHGQAAHTHINQAVDILTSTP